MIEKDPAQPEVDPQPLPAGKSKNLRPRARPLKRAKAQAQARVTSSSSLPPQNMGQIQPDASGATAVEIVESVQAPPPTQGVENENSGEDVPRLSHKRQKILDQSRSEFDETMNRSGLAKGNTS